MNKHDIADASIAVIDPIRPDEAAAPDEQLKKEQLGEILATGINATCCEQHGSPHTRWHVSIEMRAPISVRDRFFVTLNVDDHRHLDLGPMSADVANHLLAFVESGIDAKRLCTFFSSELAPAQEFSGLHIYRERLAE